MFEEAVRKFSSELTQDGRKRLIADSATSLEDVLTVVAIAKARFDLSHKNSRAKKWIGKVSMRIQYYGNIMDVLVQHHPEYVSLAWGAMKLFFVVRLTICGD